MIQDLKQESGMLLMITIMEIIARVMMCDLLLSLTQKLLDLFCVIILMLIFFTGNIKVQNGNDATRVAIKNCHSFTRASFKLNNEQVDTADNLNLTMNLYNMLEYSDNYADTTGSLYQYKRLEPRDNNGNVVNLSTT